MKFGGGRVKSEARTQVFHVEFSTETFILILLLTLLRTTNKNQTNPNHMHNKREDSQKITLCYVRNHTIIWGVCNNSTNLTSRPNTLSARRPMMSLRDAPKNGMFSPQTRPTNNAAHRQYRVYTSSIQRQISCPRHSCRLNTAAKKSHVVICKSVHNDYLLQILPDRLFNMTNSIKFTNL